jgi:predicted lipid-binding transport protein (Tim44 family)
MDVILLALAAAFVVYRMLDVMGVRDDHSVERRKKTVRHWVMGGDEALEDDTSSGLRSVGPDPLPYQAETATDFRAMIDRLRVHQPSFSEASFLEGARDAYTMVIQAFNRADRLMLETLLAPSVSKHFIQSLDQAAAAGHRAETVLVSVETPVWVRGHIAPTEDQGEVAFATLRFKADHIELIRDASGAVIEGDPSYVRSVEDLWTFAHPVEASSPHWRVVATNAV